MVDLGSRDTADGATDKSRRGVRYVVIGTVIALAFALSAAIVSAASGSRVHGSLTPVEPGGDERPGDRISIENDDNLPTRAESDAIFSDRIVEVLADPDEWGCRTADGSLFTVLGHRARGQNLIPADPSADAPSSRKLPPLPDGCAPLDGEGSIEDFTSGVSGVGQ